MTDVDRILFAIDAFLQDDYDLCHSFGSVLDRCYPESAWADVAEKLKSRLPAQAADKQSRATADYTRSYHRERLSGWIIDALEAAGDKEAATDFCIEEATQAGSYQRAVDRLIAQKRYDEAKELASQGLKNTDPTYAGLINRLQDSLATIAAKYLSRNNSAILHCGTALRAVSPAGRAIRTECGATVTKRGFDFGQVLRAKTTRSLLRSLQSVSSRVLAFRHFRSC